MADYRVIVARSARKELERLRGAAADRVLAKLEQLAAEPRLAGSRKLHGSAYLWRVRVGDYRVVYAIDDAQKIVDIRVVRHRKDAYR
ncbi:MAG: type II toxin-antitoxin system RelE/ParE family toxin [Acidobacteria bacterium]|nr:type II toxin-antitoxin system RelE/ParE family toxin [Acidobacteriota bacterium]